jgi:periplasmic protein TonB
MKAVVFALGLLATGLSARLAAAPAIQPPIPVRTSAPVFPEEMRRQGVSGYVLVNCLIDARGNVVAMKIEKATDEAFVPPAEDALKKWKFKPAQRDGSDVAIRVDIPIRFTIDEG